MRDRKTLTKALAEQYQRAGKKAKEADIVPVRASHGIQSLLRAAALSYVVPRLVQSRQLRLSKQVQNQLLEISPVVIDQLLKPYRAKHALKGCATTRPGTLLKHQTQADLSV